MTTAHERLSKLMQRRGAVRQLCLATGWHTSTVRSIQAGRSPTVEQAGIMERLLGIPVSDWLPAATTTEV